MDQQPVAELARAIITQIAPRELPVFGPVSRAWFADPKPTRLRTGGDKALGYGLTDTIPLITHLLTLPLGTVVDLRKPSTQLRPRSAHVHLLLGQGPTVQQERRARRRPSAIPRKRPRCVILQRRHARISQRCSGGIKPAVFLGQRRDALAVTVCPSGRSGERGTENDDFINFTIQECPLGQVSSN